MILKRIKVDMSTGEQTNCYIVADEYTKEAMVIDPGGNVDKIKNMISVLGVNIKYIYITHCHGDHIGGVDELKKTLGGQILIHTIDERGYQDESVNLTYFIGLPNPEIPIDSRVNDSDIIHVGNLEFKVLHTPGHTKGSTCLYSKEQKMLFSGDTVFRGTWGRTDLPTGSLKDIIRSIENKIMTLPEETIIYPGHGKSSMVKEEGPIYLNLKGNQ